MFDTCGMGWQNPAISWQELERRLSGRAPFDVGTHPDGGDSPAWSRRRDSYRADPRLSHGSARVLFADLHVHSSFSFLDGAASPEHLVEEAVRLGLQALALTDHDGLYGVVRFAEAAEAHGLPTIFGAELQLDVEIAGTHSHRQVSARTGVADPPGWHLLALARDPRG